MKRRLLSLLLTLCMLLSLFPTAALATGPNGDITDETTLQQAIEDSEAGAAIGLDADISLTSGIDVDKALTLNLNGHSIYSDSGWSGGDYLVAVKRGGNLTINGPGSISTDNEAIYCAVKMTVKDEPENGTAAQLTVNDGAALTGYYYGISGNGTRHNTNVTVNNAVITGTHGAGIYNPQRGNVIINDGTIYGAESGIEIRSGSLTVNGGTISCDPNASYNVSGNGNGTTTVGAGIAVAQHVTEQLTFVTINDGVISGPVSLSIANPQGNSSEAPVLAVTGGTFSGKVVKTDDRNPAGFISGGIFDTNVNDYVASDSAAVKTGSNRFEVGESAYSENAPAANNYSVTVSKDGQTYSFSETKRNTFGSIEKSVFTDQLHIDDAQVKTVLNAVLDEAVNGTTKGYKVDSINANNLSTEYRDTDTFTSDPATQSKIYNVKPYLVCVGNGSGAATKICDIPIENAWLDGTTVKFTLNNIGEEGETYNVKHYSDEALTNLVEDLGTTTVDANGSVTVSASQFSYFVASPSSPQYTLTLESGIDGIDAVTYTLSEGGTTTLNIPEAWGDNPNPGYTFKDWGEDATTGDPIAAGTVFTMPANDVTLTARWDPEVAGEIEGTNQTAELWYGDPNPTADFGWSYAPNDVDKTGELTYTLARPAGWSESVPGQVYVKGGVGIYRLNPNDGTLTFQQATKNTPVFTDGKLEPTPAQVTASYVVSGQTIATKTVTFTPVVYDKNATRDVVVNKVWVDDVTDPAARPEIALHLFQGDVEVTATPAVESIDTNNVKYTYTVPVFNVNPDVPGTEEYVYTVTEDPVQGYTTSDIEGDYKTGFTVTNTADEAVETVEVTAILKWEDFTSATRPEPSSVNLVLWGSASGEPQTKNVINLADVPGLDTNADEWTVKWDNLPKLTSSGKEYKYSVSESVVGGGGVPYGYTKEHRPAYNSNNKSAKVVDGTAVIANIYSGEPTAFTVTKVWNDDNNRDGLRPSSVTVQLKANDVLVTNKEVVLNEANNWTGSFEKLPTKTNTGADITYSIQEVEVSDYTSEITDSAEGWTITNTHEPAQVTIEGTITWVDDNDSVRPDSLTLALSANGTDTGITAEATADAEGNWSYAFPAQPAKENGTEITYTVAPTNLPEGYTSTQEGYDFTNTYSVTTVNVTASVIWDDGDNRDGVRPDSVKIRLYKNGKPADTQEVTAADDWTYTWENLDRLNGSKENLYTVNVIAPTRLGYTARGADNAFAPPYLGPNGDRAPEAVVSANPAENGGSATITIKRTPDVIDPISVTKVWDDNENAEGFRPDSVELKLMADGVAVGTATATNEDSWTGTFTSITGDPFYVNNKGTAISYTVEEELDDILGYTAIVEGDAENGFTVTNKRDLALTTVNVEIVWDDSYNNIPDYEKYRPTGSLTVGLQKNGSDVKVTDPGFENYKPLVLSNGNWSGQFADLPVYDSEGNEIQYSVRYAKSSASAVTDSKYTIAFSNEGNNWTITNKHEVEMINVTVNKVWEGAEEGDKVPVLFEVYSNLVEVDSGTVSDTFVSKDLPKYDGNGHEDSNLIAYTVNEKTVPDGFKKSDPVEDSAYTWTITNTKVKDPVTTVVQGKIIWNDLGNADGKRPTEATLTLYADDRIAQIENPAVTVNSANDWSTIWTGVPKYQEDGETEIVYTVGASVASLVPAYTAPSQNPADVVQGVATLTYDYSSAPQTVSGSVTWTDDGNAQGLRSTGTAQQVNIYVYKEGNSAKSVAALGAYFDGTAWKLTSASDKANKKKPDGPQRSVTPVSGTVDVFEYAFDNLPKYDDKGDLIKYTVTETLVNNVHYKVNNDGFDFENVLDAQTANYTVRIDWDDASNQDGLRPETVNVTLYDVSDSADPSNNQYKVVEGFQGEGDTWTYVFENVPKTLRGEAAKFTVGVNGVTLGNVNDAYKRTYTNPYTAKNLSGTFDAGNNAVVTFRHVPATLKDIPVTKIWENFTAAAPDVTLNLLADGEQVDSLTYNFAQSGNATTFPGPYPKFKDGQEIVYTVTENPLDNFTSEVTGDVENGFTVTNTFDEDLDHKIPVEITWEDFNDQDGIRPDRIVLWLYQDGDLYLGNGAPLTLSAENGWKGVWSVPRMNKATNQPFTYEVKEAERATLMDSSSFEPAYSYEVIQNPNGSFTVVYRLASGTPEQVKVEVVKVWLDEDGNVANPPILTTPLEFSLFADDFTTPVQTKNIVSNDDNVEFESPLYRYRIANEQGGIPIEYRVQENAVPEGYSVISIEPEAKDANGKPEPVNGVIKFTVTNQKNKAEMVDVTGKKLWDDNNNADGNRPKSITLNLSDANGVVKQMTVVYKENGDKWQLAQATNDGSQFEVISGGTDTFTYRFKDLPKLDSQGNPITYKVTEDFVPGYVTSYDPNDPYLITNRYSSETINVTVTKVWDDNNNQDGKRPATATISLYKQEDMANGNPVAGAVAAADVTLTGTNAFDANTWQTTVTLPAKVNNQNITYVAYEAADQVSGYEVFSVTGDQTNGFTVTNKHTPQKMNIHVNVEWDDNNNQDGMRPSGVTVYLRANDVQIAQQAALPDAWECIFSDLPVYANGEPIEYSVAQSNAREYHTDDPIGDVSTGFTITNTHTPGKRDVTAVVEWQDNDNQDGVRPASVELTLFAIDVNGTTIGTQYQTVSAANNWTAKWDNLDVYQDGQQGKPITYAVSQTQFKQDGSSNVDPNYNVYNEKNRPTYEPPYSDEGKSARADLDATARIINVHVPETFDIPVTKVWNDNDNQDSVRPGEVTVHLYADETQVGQQTITDTGVTFPDQPKFKNGKEIQYTISEDAVENYISEIAPNYADPDTGKVDPSQGFTVTNIHEPDQTTITVRKTWNDNDNQDGKRPVNDSIRVYIKADGENYDIVTLSAANGWQATKNVPMYQSGAVGQLVSYTVEELDVPAGYTPSYEIDNATGIYQVINTHVPDTIDINVVKTWVEADGDASSRQSLLVYVYNAENEIVESGELVGDSTDAPWTVTIKGLDKYEDGGKLVEYKVLESTSNLDGRYTQTKNERTPILTGPTGKLTGYTFNLENTKKIDPATVAVTVSKDWVYVNDIRDGKEPMPVFVRLLCNGKVVDGVPDQLLNADGNWSYTWTELPKEDAEGTPYNYSVAELDGTKQLRGNDVTAEGYKVTYSRSVSPDGSVAWAIANTYDPQKITIEGAKTWVDNDNADGNRPKSVVMHLYADGVDTGLTANTSKGKFSFGQQPMFTAGPNGTLINYTVVEELPDGYVNEVTGFNVKNIYNPGLTEINGMVIWEDDFNRDGIRPESVTLELWRAPENNQSSGEKVDTQTVTETSGWTYSWKVPSKVNNQKVVYTVKETVADWETLEGLNYSKSYGYPSASGKSTKASPDDRKIAPITFKYTPETVTGIQVFKIWEDSINQDGKRPESVTVYLMNGSEQVDKLTFSGNKTNRVWTSAFTGKYPAKANGEPINYTLVEDIPDGYTMSGVITGNVEEGFRVTNTYDPENVTIQVIKNWEDTYFGIEDYDKMRPESVDVKVMNGSVEAAVLTLSAVDGGWSKSVNLPKYENGQEIQYTVAETDVPNGYQVESVYEAGIDTWVVTNRHELETTSVYVQKAWVGDSAVIDKRPDSLTIQAYGESPNMTTQLLGEVQLTNADDWKGIIGNLPKNDGHGGQIQYIVRESAAPEGYTYNGFSGSGSDTDPYIISNKLKGEKTNIVLTKTWDDNNDQDKMRPSLADFAKKVTLWYKTDETDEKKSTLKPVAVALNNDNTYQLTWQDVNRLAPDGSEYSFRVTENVIDGYNDEVTAAQGSVEDGFTLTNSHDTSTRTVTVYVKWDDNNDQDGKRPENVADLFDLTADGKTLSIAPSSVTYDDATSTYTLTWTDLQENQDGKEITYEVAPYAEIDGYTVSDSPAQDKGTITLTHTPETTAIRGMKIWDDDSNRDGKRPESVVIRLTSGGEISTEYVIVAKYTDDAWKLAGLAEGSKIPAGLEDQVRLAVDNSQDNSFEFCFDKLPKYANGELINYFVQEDRPDGYTVDYNWTAPEKVEITNSYEPGMRSITVVKDWVDADDQDAIRPEFAVFSLSGKAGGKDVAVEDSVARLNSSDPNASYTWTVPEKENGKEIVYSITEAHVNGYETTYSQTNAAGELQTSQPNTDGNTTVEKVNDRGYVIFTNKHVPDLVDIEVSKTWEGKVGESAYITLWADYEELKTVDVMDPVYSTKSDTDTWTYTFKDLPKFENGSPINYKVTEAPLAHYSGGTVTGPEFTLATGDSNEKLSFFVTNVYNPGMISVNVTKIWEDSYRDSEGNEIDNYYGKRVPVNVNLYRFLAEKENWADTFEVVETVELNEGNDWSYHWEKLPMETEMGERYTYFVRELNAAGNYVAEDTSLVFADLGALGTYNASYSGEEYDFRITNTLKVETKNIGVTKEWKGDANALQNRPAFVSVDLLANGKKVDSLTLNSASNWVNTFKAVPVYDRNGNAITYTLNEEDLSYKGYQPTYEPVADSNNWKITNTLYEDTFNVVLTKTWDDAHNQDGVRPTPEQFGSSVSLWADGSETTVATPEVAYGADQDTYVVTWRAVPVTNEGKEIDYQVKENAISGYNDNTLTADKISENRFELTNTHTLETTDVSITVKWDDDNNRDGLRPTDLIPLLTLYENGKPVQGAAPVVKTVSAKGDTYNVTGDTRIVTWYGLPKFSNGSEITYTVGQDGVKGYTTTGNPAPNGGTIVNVHEIEKVIVTASKIWDDNDNQDGKRPDWLTFSLRANGNEVYKFSINRELNQKVGSAVDEKVQISGKDEGGLKNFTFTYVDPTKPAGEGAYLPKNENGKPIDYTIAETAVKDYSTTVEPDGNNKWIITNTHAIGKTDVHVDKVWEDNLNQDGMRPGSVDIILYKNGEKFLDKVLTGSMSDNVWSYSWTGLDAFENGKKIVYTVGEKAVNGYEGPSAPVAPDAANTVTITNKHVPETVNVIVEKKWDGKEGDSAVITLKSSAGYSETYKLTADSWVHEFQNLPKYENGKEIRYGVSEQALDHYKLDSITGPAVIKDAAGNEQQKFVVTNVFVPNMTTVTATKKWEDSYGSIQDYDGVRPKEVTVTLVGTANGVEVSSDTVKLTEKAIWTHTWNVPLTDEFGTKIEYTVTEDPVPYYSTEVKGDATVGYTIVNTHEVELVDFDVQKVWIDSKGNTVTDYMEPIYVLLRSVNGTMYGQSIELSQGTGWTGKFQNLPKFAQGAYALQDDTLAVEYTVVEANVPDGYICDVSGSMKDGFTITNTQPQIIDITVEKIWDDGDNRDGKRPEYIVAELYVNNDGTIEKVQGVEPLFIDGSANTNTWYGKWMNLPAGDYLVREVAISDAYTVEYQSASGFMTPATDDSYAYPTASGRVIIKNVHTPNTTDVTGTKIWNDNGNQDGVRPAELTFKLLANGLEVRTVTVSTQDGSVLSTTPSESKVVTSQIDPANGSFAFTFKNLPEYENGELIRYSISEGYTADYSSDNFGFEIVNTYTPGKRDVTVHKIWDDDNNRDGIRPESVLVSLRNVTDDVIVGSATLTAENNWSCKFVDLDAMKDGTAIEYTVEETTPAGYTCTLSGSADSDFILTNSHNPDTVNVTVKKVWNGGPMDPVTVNLLANGAVVNSATLSKASATVTFTTDSGGSSLLKNADGKKIIYTVTENAQENYSVEISDPSLTLATATDPETIGYTITNTFEPGTRSITATMKWNDSDNYNGYRPDSVQVGVYKVKADGTTELVEGTVRTLSEGTNWTTTWNDLPVNETINGSVEPINYVVREVVPDKYTATVVGDMETGYTVTNTNTVETMTVTALKSWIGDSWRPNSISVDLYADGAYIGTKNLKADSDVLYNWRTVFDDLPRFKAGSEEMIEIHYTVEEQFVFGYTSDVALVDDAVGFVYNVTYEITNTPVEFAPIPVPPPPHPHPEPAPVPQPEPKPDPDPVVPIPVEPDPVLNKEDHFAYIIGYPDGTVRPQATITRAEVATIFFRLLTDSARNEIWSQTNSYSDVSLDQWFNNAISTLTKGEYLNGYEDGTFHPDNAITRAEFATMASRFLEDGKTGGISFTDVSGHWAEGYITKAAANGIIDGYPDGTYRPDQAITRAEAMTIINRLLERYPDKDHLHNDMLTWTDNSDTSAWYYAQVQEATNSHSYTMNRELNPIIENWTAILPVRDWDEFERAWSDANSATNPGEVMHNQ